MTPKDEAKAAVMTLKEMIGKDMSPLERKLAAATADHALEQIDKLTVARPRKGAEVPAQGALEPVAADPGL